MSCRAPGETARSYHCLSGPTGSIGERIRLSQNFSSETSPGGCQSRHGTPARSAQKLNQNDVFVTRLLRLMRQWDHDTSQGQDRRAARLRPRVHRPPVARPTARRADAAGVDPERIYRDKLSGTSTREQRPGLAALLDYARPGDAIVVVGIDRLGRNAAEVMTTIRELRDREIVLRSLREGIDTSNATGRMVAGVLASLAELELELGRERRAAAREARRARGQTIGRPKALDRPRPRWRAGCTPAANRSRRSRPRSAFSCDGVPGAGRSRRADRNRGRRIMTSNGAYSDHWGNGRKC